MENDLYMYMAKTDNKFINQTYLPLSARHVRCRGWEKKNSSTRHTHSMRCREWISRVDIYFFFIFSHVYIQVIFHIHIWVSLNTGYMLFVLCIQMNERHIQMKRDIYMRKITCIFIWPNMNSSCYVRRRAAICAFRQ